jgi:hypothetical protein
MIGHRNKHLGSGFESGYGSETGSEIIRKKHSNPGFLSGFGSRFNPYLNRIRIRIRILIRIIFISVLQHCTLWSLPLVFLFLS